MTAARIAWPPLESSPVAFTALGRRLGMRESFSFQDVLGLDPELLSVVPRPVCAVVLLYPTSSAKIENFRRQMEPAFSDKKNPFYCHQYVGNGCGVFALLHCLWIPVHTLANLQRPRAAIKAPDFLVV